jgi:hypothetical protein
VTEGSEGGSPELSMAALVADGEPAVVEQRNSQGHRRGGRGSSRRQCGAQGGDGEFEGGPGALLCGSSTTAMRCRSGGKGQRRKKRSSGGAFIAARGGG